MLRLNERPSGRVLLATIDIPAEYHADRLRWWTINSPSWSAHIDADRNRGELLAKLAARRGGREAIDALPRSLPIRFGLDLIGARELSDAIRGWMAEHSGDVDEANGELTERASSAA